MLDCFLQDRFRTHRRIEQIRAGAPFKGREAVQIKDIVGGAMVHQIGILERGDANLMGNRCPFCCVVGRSGFNFGQPLLGFLFHHLDKTVHA